MKTRLVASVVTLLAAAAAVHAVPPPPGDTPTPVEFQEFFPNAGYFRTLSQQRLERRLSGGAAAPGAPALSGRRSLPVLLVKFKNTSGTLPTQEEFRAMLFGPIPKPGEPEKTNLMTLTQYYRDASGGRLEITGVVQDWFKLSQNDTYYEDGNNGKGAKFGELLTEALINADQTVDFSQFDNDGPDGIPNSGDDDGIVDTIVIIHPETGGENGNKNIWSHSSNYSRFGKGSFVTDDNSALIGFDGKARKIRIEDYVVQPALNKKGARIEVGVFCHEYGHALGLPDLYDRTPSPTANSAGLGHWCLMAAGNYGGNGSNAARPTFMSAWARELLGWADVQLVTGSGPLNVEPTIARNRVYRFNTDDPDEYFLMELRDPAWKLEGAYKDRINWDADLPERGVAIWHVDNRVGRYIANGTQFNPRWPFSPYDQGQNDSPTRATFDNSAFEITHALVALVEANGKEELAYNRKRVNSGHLWVSGKKFGDDPKFVAGSRAYSGKETGIGISEFALNKYSIVVDLTPPSGNGSLPAGGMMAAANLPSAPIPDTPAAEAAVRVSDQIEKFKEAKGALTVPTAAKSSAPAAGSKPFIGALNSALTKKNVGAITARDVKDVSKLENWEIERFVRPADSQAALKLLAAESRTTPLSLAVATLERSTEATGSGAGGSLLSFAGANAEAKLAPDGKRIEQITGLNIPAQADTTKDAQQRVDGMLRPTIGLDVNLAKAKSGVAPTIKQFQQLASVDGRKELPVFGAEVKLFYQDGAAPALTTVTNTTVAPDKLKVTGGAGTLGAVEAKQILATTLGLPPEQITGDGQEGVYLAQGNPNNGRVARRFNIKIGTQQADLIAYVDTETKKVLAVK